MKIKLDLSKFKLHSKDDKIAILEHPDGHMFHVAVTALHPENRKSLDALQMATGGEVNKKEDKGPYIDPKKAAEAEKGATKSGWQPEEWKKNLKKGLGLAKGGEVNPKLEQSKLSPRMAEGGEMTIPQDEAFQDPRAVQFSRDMASVSDGEQAPQAAAPAPMAPPPAAAAPQMAPQVQPQTPQAAAPEQSAPAADAQPQMAEQQQPDTMQGYQKQVAGIQEEAQAKAEQAKQEQAAMSTQLEAINNMKTDYETHVQALNSEREALQEDIKNQHIDPQRYMGSKDTGSRIATAIGLILGGMGAGMTGTSNDALDFLNKQIDRDIDAQRAELGKKETLLSANMKQFNNLHDATQMTKVMQNDMTIAQLKKAEAQASSPIAKARAQQMIGQLEMQVAPMVQQLATRKMLQQGAQQGGPISNIDPATLVPSVVPEHHQEAVYKELERAQNTRQVAKTAIQNFDEVTKQMKSAGGLGRLGAAAYSPAQLQALEAELGSTVGDMEGTVREAAMHNVKNAYLPRASDTAARLDERRKELANYLNLKSSAPRAKSFGIDIDKFSTTSRKPEARMTPQQQSFAEWAKQNPQDPRSALILKKLGL